MEIEIIEPIVVPPREVVIRLSEREFQDLRVALNAYLRTTDGSSYGPSRTWGRDADWSYNRKAVIDQILDCSVGVKG